MIAGGEFWTASGGSARRIARWNGSEWQRLGTGLNRDVNALTVFNGDLIVGGGFTQAGEVAANQIARWDGSTWHALGSGMSYYYVYSLTVYNGELIAGGEFTMASGVTANRIVRHDGWDWQPLGSAMNSDVLSLRVHNGDLIAGGVFTTAGEEDYAYIARWDMPVTDDNDGDGYFSDVDCDDNDPYTHPGAAPNDNASACMRDADEDDYGDASAPWPIEAGTDCNDAVASIYPGAAEILDDGIDQDCNGADAITCYLDADQDGYGSDAGTVVIAEDGVCNTSQNESYNMTDCDDAAASIYPGATEVLDDGIDQDCNGADAITCYVDADQDGYGTDAGTVVIAEDGSCDTWAGEAEKATDCNDAEASIYPYAPEVPDDGIDQDCNGYDAITCIVDADHDGYGTDAGTTVIAPDGSCDMADGESDNTSDCDDAVASVYPGATEVLDDGIDQDCNGTDAITCYVDADHDGYGSDAATVIVAEDGSCDTPAGESDNANDCHDFNDMINPGATEIWYDEIDWNCDGMNDYDQDADGYVHEDYNAQAGGSAPGIDDCVDTDLNVYPGATEIPDDGIDQDCNGEDLTTTCCVTRVGDANGQGGDEPTIGDASVMIDAKFISGICDGLLECLAEADLNQSGGLDPDCSDITIGDISILIDYLFIRGSSVVVLPNCL